MTDQVGQSVARPIERTRRDFWDQITVDNDTALMSQDVFDRLPEYSCSVPTGTRVGKRWKRREPHHGEPHKWFMGEYQDRMLTIRRRPKQRWVVIHWRDIVIETAEEYDRTKATPRPPVGAEREPTPQTPSRGRA